MSDIAIYNDILDEDFRKELLEESHGLLLDDNGFVWKTNYSWVNGIVLTSQAVLTRIYDQERSNQIMKCLFDKGIFDPEGNYTVMNYVWTKMSYIPWHSDNHARESMTIYLNNFWHTDWGGIFLYMDNDQIRGHFPWPNTAIKNNSAVSHMVTPITSNAEEFRFTVQIWRNP